MYLLLSVLALLEGSKEGIAAQEAPGVAVTVVLLPQDASRAAAYKDALNDHPFLRRLGPTTLRFVEPEAVATQRPSGPILVVGMMEGLLRSSLLGAGLPSGDHPGSGETLAAIIANPWDADHPMLLAVGAGDQAVIDYLVSGQLPRRGGYELRRDDLRLRVGRLETGAERNGRRGPVRAEDVRPLLREVDVGSVRVGWIDGETTEKDARAVAGRAARLLLSFTGAIGCEGEGETLRAPVRNAQEARIFVHATRQVKALRTGDPRSTHALLTPGRPPLVHLVQPSAGEGFAAEGIARAALRLCGDVGVEEPLAEGASSYLAGSILGRDLDWWEARIAGLGRGSNEAEEGSWLSLRPAAALRVRRLVKSAAPGSLGRLLTSRTNQGKTSPQEGTRPPRRGLEVTSPIAFQKGMSLAHEGYAVVDGYGSDSSAAQMARLKELGVDWIALIPYAFMNDPARPRIEFLRSERQGGGMENDFAIAADVAAAHALGLKVMLKPQIWLGQGRWPGQIAMTSQEDWKAFFREYRAFLTHYSLLAAATGADLLVIGVELVKATAARPDDWRALIDHARDLYDGPMTYAANWGEEVEAIPFWDRLDFIGVDCYYPLSADPKADDEALRAGAVAIALTLAKISGRAGRPVLLTEAGFPALEASWIAPHDDEGNRPGSPHSQARGYRALMDALWDRPWLAGIYWWKWPTVGVDAREGRDRFSPRGLPAERVIAEWFLRPQSKHPDWTGP